MEINVFFSIIIPTLNEEQYLPGLLEDLVKQTYRNFEVIVVDGGSHDKTVLIAKKYHKKLLLQVITTNLKNVAKQRNLGAKKAKGNYLFFIDADAQVKPELIISIKNKILLTNCQLLTTLLQPDSQSIFDKLIAIYLNLVIKICKIFGKPFAGSNIICSQFLFRKVGAFDPDKVPVEDFDFTLRAGNFGFGIDYINTPLIIYSTRRYQQENRLKILANYLLISLDKLVGIKIPKIVKYQMGGHVYKK